MELKQRTMFFEHSSPQGEFAGDMFATFEALVLRHPKVTGQQVLMMLAHLEGKLLARVPEEYRAEMTRCALANIESTISEALAFDELKHPEEVGHG